MISMKPKLVASLQVIVSFLITIQSTKALDLQCPDPQAIFPCICYHDRYFKGLTMDCSNVTSADELRTVFSKDFPSSDFRALIITFNEKWNVLREGDLGSASFEEVYLEYSDLAEIEDSALLGSRDTLSSLVLYGDKLKALPDISAFTKLENLGLTGNDLGQFPILESTTLKNLDLGGNKITEIPVDATAKLPSLAGLLLYCNFITGVQSETFAGNKHLSMLDLRYNNISKLPDYDIALQGNDSTLNLGHNHITHLSYESLQSVTGELHLEGCELAELPEKIFRPLLEKSEDVQLFVDDNPFGCGCDMAWLITNRTFLSHIAFIPACSNGTFIHELDPQYYVDNC